MDVFPTQYSTLSAAALKDHLEKCYGFSGMSCRLLIRNISDTYILEGDSGKYIFKIYRDAHRKPEEIRSEVELLNILKREGASVSYPIPGINGAYLIPFNAAEGVRYGVLLSFAEGAPAFQMNEQQLRKVGHEMAFIHTISASISLSSERKEYNTYTTILRPLEILKPAFTGLEGHYRYLHDMGHKVADILSQLPADKFSTGYCHFDYLAKNFHFTDDGTLTFFDFDFAGKGFLAYDVTSFYIHYFLEVIYGKIKREEADKAFSAFLESYRQTKPFTDEELKAIPYLGFSWWLFYLGFQYESYDDWSNIFFNPRFIVDRVGLMKKWMEYSNTAIS